MVLGLRSVAKILQNPVPKPTLSYYSSSGLWLILSDMPIQHWGTLNLSPHAMEGGQPPPRYGHFSAAVGGKVCVWGGDFSTNKGVLASPVYVFNPFQESWTQQTPGGFPPPRLHNGACTSSGHCLYVYGGSDGSCSYNSLYQLDTMSWTWKYFPSDTTPMPKTGCRMVVHDNKLVLFGGHGFPCGPIQQGSKFTRDKRFRDGAGWTNELHTFDLRQGEISYLYWSVKWN